MSVNIYNSNPNASSEAENFQTVADRGSKLASDTIYSNTTSGLNSVNVQGAIDEVNEKVDPIKAHTRTNLLNPTAQTQTKNGVTFTNNGNGTYTVNGTASADTAFDNVYRTTEFPTGINTKLTGCPSGGSTSSYYMAIVMEGVGPYYDRGNGVEIPLTSSANALRLLIGIKSGTTCDNLLFKPMLTTDLNATYDDYVRYSGPGELNENVAEMYEDISQINSDLSDIKTGNVTWNTTNKTSGTATLVKIGRICQLTLDQVTYSSITHATTIFTVPDEFKPVKRAWIPIVQVSSTLDATKDWTTFPVALETNGNAIIYSTSGSASARLTSAKATITYISAS